LTALISNIDANIGKLFDRLQTLKKDDNTIVVFLTDNGTAAGWPAGMRSEGIGLRRRTSRTVFLALAGKAQAA
jgi:arylsulfatase A-like enzyme